MEIFPPNYVYALLQEEYRHHWPNLKLSENFIFTSKKRKGHNCVGWALDDEVKDLDMLVFKNIYNLNPDSLDHTVKGYAKIFSERHGYLKCENDSVEEGYEKIALYGDEDNDFKHVARQLDNGNWVSKMGTLEDIEHFDLTSLIGDEYGLPKMFMKRLKKKKLENATL